MNKPSTNKKLIWVALLTILLLTIPFLLMSFKIPLLDPGSSYEVLNWDIFDFVVMGTLIFGAGGTFVLIARKVSKKYRLALGILLILLFLWVWAELAVGVFTNWGN
ncbi:MAG: hypothetical protein ACOZAO_02395 [Patescibacteria group bacterium]